MTTPDTPELRERIQAANDHGMPNALVPVSLAKALLDRLDALEGRGAEVDRITDAFDETLSLSWRRFALARDLAKALTWALAEIDGETKYETEAQRQNCRDKADEVLAAHRAPESPTTLADEGRDAG